MLPFLIPVIILEIALLVFALVDLFKREHLSSNTRLIWALVIILLNIIGRLSLGYRLESYSKKYLPYFVSAIKLPLNTNVYQDGSSIPQRM